MKHVSHVFKHLTYSRGRKDTSFNRCKALINPYAKLLCIWILMVCVEIHRLITEDETRKRLNLETNLVAG
jgi:hypothetical protein